MNSMKLMKIPIDCLAGLWARGVLHFGYQTAAGLSHDTIDELSACMHRNEGDLSDGVRAVMRLYDHYRRSYQASVKKSTERRQEIDRLSAEYLQLRGPYHCIGAGNLPGGNERKTFRGHRVDRILEAFLCHSRKMIARVLRRFEVTKLKRLNEIAAEEKIVSATDEAALFASVKELVAKYQRLYDQVSTESSERMERVEKLSSACRVLRKGRMDEVLVPNRKIAFLHIPKTGGTSLRQMLVNAFPGAAMLDAGNWPLERAEKGELDAFDIIFGHMYLENLDKHREGRYKVIFFRDPVMQAASLWSWLRSYDKDPELSKRPDIVAALKYDFDEYVRTDDPNAFNLKCNRYARMLFGEKAMTALSDQEKSGMIADKLAEIDFIGIFEHFREDARMLLEALGAPKGNDEVWLNQTSKRLAEAEIPQDTREVILEKCFLDFEVYRQSLNRREERLRAAVALA